VERKYEQDFNFKPKRNPEIDQEKSKKSLGEIYEDEFVKQAHGETGGDDKLEKTHQQISKMFRSLCFKLDALSNAHFAPKPVRPSHSVFASLWSLNFHSHN